MCLAEAGSAGVVGDFRWRRCLPHGGRNGHHETPPGTQEAYAFREEPVTGPLFSLNPRCLIPKTALRPIAEAPALAGGRVVTRKRPLSWLRSWKRARHQQRWICSQAR